MAKRFLNVRYNGVNARINVTEMDDISDVQDAIKATFGNTFEKIDAPYLQLFQPLENGEKEILDLEEIPEDYYRKVKEGGLSLVIRCSQLSVAGNVVSPKKVLKDLLGFDVEDSQVIFSRPSVVLSGFPTSEISYIAPLMNFVCRDQPTQIVYNTLDDYLDWKDVRVGEAEKNIKFVTVVGTAGKGKTTFARRFLELPYTGKHAAIINDCRDSDRSYCVSCCDFDLLKDGETQLSLLVLFEAFKYSLPVKAECQSFIRDFFKCFPSFRVSFTTTLQFITETFCFESSPELDKRLVIINLDETNNLLTTDEGQRYLKDLLCILRSAARGTCLLTILSGTHSDELFQQFQISCCRFVDIELSLIGLEEAKEVILEMTTNPSEHHISPFLEYLLTLCGGVGRYLEFAIVQMSIMGSADMGGTVIQGFKLDAYVHFLKNMQTSQHIETLLDKLTTAVVAYYPNVFSRFSDFIELLSCYALFQWTVSRQTKVNHLSIGDLEKEGLVFLQPTSKLSYSYICIIPFITLYWAIKYCNQSVQIPFLKDIKSYFSPDESENNSLHIVMAKFWGLYRKDSLPVDATGNCRIKLSDLVTLRDGQVDAQIRFRPVFTITDAPEKIEMNNYKRYKSDPDSIAFLNAKGATFTDAVIFSEPMIGIRILKGLEELNNQSFKSERDKFPPSDIFILITDEKQGEIVLGDNDVVIDCESFRAFAGPLIALRKLYCLCPEKNIKFVTVVGTAGKGKTTFARRFLELPYTGKHAAIINDCRDSNRSYCVSCCDFDLLKDGETQLSLLVLFEAFKYSLPAKAECQSFIRDFFKCFPSFRVSFTTTLQFITETFCFESSPELDKRLVIINLDETNNLLTTDEGQRYLKDLLCILRSAARGTCLLTILSGTHSDELFQQFQISCCRFVDIELSLIGLEEAKEVILEMTMNPREYHISPYLEYLLALCGGVGRYLELAIVQMSIMGSADMGGTVIQGFKLDAYVHFLKNMQTSQHIETLLDKLTTAVVAYYPNVFSRFSDFIELLSCYALFQWTVSRQTKVNHLSIGDLEKEGLVFLQPTSKLSFSYICIIPFITLYWAIKYCNQSVQIPFLKDIKSYFSPDESENNSLHIVMAKFWGLYRKDSLPVDATGNCRIKLSDLVTLRDGQVNVQIRFRPVFTITDAPEKIEMNNYKRCKSDPDSIAFLNAKGATFTDAVIFSEPMIGIRILEGLEELNEQSFKAERDKFPPGDIFILITDAKQGEIVLGDNDVVIDCESFQAIAGPLIALRKLCV
ncbi:hypothetical protein HK103_001134 [Boothiomyces macroporosus]|uniref:Uncharacterized protein n=1 Tax=Boothiomyces macroporosus TaxID=261099 RepID=A0AAD5Y383_9FUNG|nr:hypothetical protein HK103_001134 [Boothiomyces macroporosus]